MSQLVAGLVLFLGVHSASIVANGARDAAVQRMGEGAWKGLYSVVSLVGFVLLVRGYGQARGDLDQIVVYAPPPWTRHLTAALMLPVFVLLLAAYLPGRIQAAAKHPMLASVILWSLAHLAANGMLQDVLLFGGFLAWAVLDRISVGRRPARPVPGAPPGRWNDLLAVILGLGLYAATLWGGHLWLIGVPPLG